MEVKYLTKSYFKLSKHEDQQYNSWEKGVIAPKLTLINLADELHYYFKIYIKQRKSKSEILFFLFLNAIQRVFYTLGVFMGKRNLIS